MIRRRRLGAGAGLRQGEAREPSTGLPFACGRSPHHLHAFSITPAHPRVVVLGERAKACRHIGGISALCRACPSSTLLAATVLAPAVPWLRPTGGDHPGTARG